MTNISCKYEIVYFKVSKDIMSNKMEAENSFIWNHPLRSELVSL